MKKWLFSLYMVIILLLFCSLAEAQNLKFEYRSGYFSPQESLIKKVYDKGWIYSFEFGLTGNFGKNHGLEVYALGKSFSRNGELTYTKENTDLEILTWGIGARYKIDVYHQIIFPYVGMGLNYKRFKETNDLAKTTKYEIGYEFQGGVYLRPFKGILKVLLFDLYLNYGSCPMKFDQRDLDIGGWTAGIGFGFEY
ncbi:MAG: hypothetical protein DRP02_13405 [Candidatus Gerdarchaeota archaeon]|nr:MAG: hypothetical protein DRP02_13405 [Candidatus Gerdarchaeota archaeon]